MVTVLPCTEEAASFRHLNTFRLNSTAQQETEVTFCFWLSWLVQPLTAQTNGIHPDVHTGIYMFTLWFLIKACKLKRKATVIIFRPSKVINWYLQSQYIYSDPMEISFISHYKLYCKNQLQILIFQNCISLTLMWNLFRTLLRRFCLFLSQIQFHLQFWSKNFACDMLDSTF